MTTILSMAGPANLAEILRGDHCGGTLRAYSGGIAGRALLQRTGPRPSQFFDILDEPAYADAGGTGMDDGVFECGEN